MPDTESKLSGWECQGWEVEVLNLSLNSRVKSVSKPKKKKKKKAQLEVQGHSYKGACKCDAHFY